MINYGDENLPQGNIIEISETEHAEDLAKKFHLKQFCKLPDRIENYDSYKNIDGYGTLHQFVEVVEQKSNQYNINDVDDPDLIKV